MSAAGQREKFWSGNEIRETFLRFFESKDHRRVRSSSLVPIGDPTLLFTNAGMNQFKDVFLGLEQRECKRATTAQKCVRAGGKHNDLENVGFTNRHHTFFEMLGNFSFGDYFKNDAIAFAWELITSPKWFAIPQDKLYATIFKGEEGIPRDDEAYEHWVAQGVPKDRIFEFGIKDNFWAMGDTGPCGPCSELHYDMGPAASDQGHADCPFGCECGRYIEIWNLVFMQFNRDASGTLAPLPKPSIDTGAGLERLAAVLQGKISNYDTDLFVPLMERAAELCGVNFQEEIRRESGKGGAASLRVVADHARATTFLITDGVLPSNEGRGYVLRKIMRRAIYHGRLLGRAKPFLYEIASTVRDQMQGAYPELGEGALRVTKMVEAEEHQFARILQTGLERWNDFVDERGINSVQEAASELLREHARDPYFQDQALLLRALPRRESREFFHGDSAPLHYYLATQLGPSRPDDVISGLEEKLRMMGFQVSGEELFKLYDTYGLPRDFIEDLARDTCLQVDWTGFESAMAEQKARARASWKGGAKESANPAYAKLAETFHTEPDFYFGTSTRDCRIEAIVTKGGQASEVKDGQEAEVLLDRTVIYAESGGQVSDIGAFYDNSGSQRLADVTGAYYPVAGLIAHKIVARETLRVGDRVAVVADAARREHIKRNHTATHLMHAALRGILGSHVKQSGSLNDPDRLRFDFSHFAPVEPEELRDVEQQVNEQIRKNAEIETAVTTLDEALQAGALAFFGDKYPERNVRVVTIPDADFPAGFYSKELCGGTHVRRSGDIGVFKIVAEQSVAAGVRRVEAITGAGAVAGYQRSMDLLRQIAGQLNVGEDAVLATLEKISQTAKQLEKQLDAQKRKGALSKLDELAAQARTVKGVKVVSAQVEDTDRETLRQLVDSLRRKLGSAVVALGTAQDGKAAIIAGVTKDLTDRVHAGKIVQAIARQLGGSGGGRPDLGEAGGKDTSGLKSALDSVYSLLEPLL